jgi:hypothetical protein
MNGTWTQGTNGAQIQGGWRYCAGCKVLYWPASESGCMYAWVTYPQTMYPTDTYYNHLSGSTDYYVFMNV